MVSERPTEVCALDLLPFVEGGAPSGSKCRNHPVESEAEKERLEHKLKSKNLGSTLVWWTQVWKRLRASEKQTTGHRLSQNCPS